MFVAAIILVDTVRPIGRSPKYHVNLAVPQTPNPIAMNESESNSDNPGGVFQEQPYDQALPPSTLTDHTGHFTDHTGHWTDGIESPTECVSCSARLIGEYCSACGQRKLTHRHRFGPMLWDAVTKFIDYESGFLHTLIELFKQPGVVARKYASGQKRNFISPITVFILGSAVQLFSLWLVQGQLVESFKVSFAAQEASNPELAAKFAKAERKLGQPLHQLMATSYITAMQQGYMYAGFLFFCLPFAFGLKLFHNALGEPVYLGETMIFALFVFGPTLIITGVMTPIALQIDMSLQAAVGIISYLVMPQWAHGGFFRRSAASRAMTALASVLAMGCFFLSIFCIGVVSFSIALFSRLG